MSLFMKAMEPGLRDDLATKADLTELGAELRVEIADVRAEMSELKATIESKLRAQTWTMVTVLIAAVGATRFL